MPKHNPIRHDLLAVGAVLLLPLVEWWDDRKPLERVAAIGKTVIVVACATVLVLTVGGCKPTEQPTQVPGIDQGHVPFHPEQALVGRLNATGAAR
jgi:hypothetical protein